MEEYSRHSQPVSKGVRPTCGWRAKKETGGKPGDTGTSQALPAHEPTSVKEGTI